jgi:predicted PurR-regulated permease PerM
MLTALILVAVFILRSVIGTVFVAITVAYVLYPLERWLNRRPGIGPRIAAGVCTVVAFLAVVAILTPLAVAFYLRRGAFFAFLSDLPAELVVEFAEMTYTVDVEGLLTMIRNAATAIAGDIARALPELALQLFLFALVVYGLLLKPTKVRGAVLQPAPDAYHDVVLALHTRTRDTLYGLYVLQAATALGTFAVAWVVFTLLGYEAAFVLAALCGLLQFIPVLGPSLIVAGLGALALFQGDVALAITVTAVGLVAIGFLPDALIRPRLAAWTTGMPATLYFIGFVGGVLSVGVVGVIAGPLIVALVAETVEILSADGAAVQQRLE